MYCVLIIKATISTQPFGESKIDSAEGISQGPTKYPS